MKSYEMFIYGFILGSLVGLFLAIKIILKYIKDLKSKYGNQTNECH